VFLILLQLADELQLETEVRNAAAAVCSLSAPAIKKGDQLGATENTARLYAA
jgi:hypothetical protein